MPPAKALQVQGTVYLVGAGPGDPELITVRGLRLIRQADVILYDRLASRELLGEAKPGARLIDVGKRAGKPSTPQQEIHRLLILHARRGRTVVRLKGGDPFVFGRGCEEREACREAAVACMVVPGISSSVAAPAAAGIPVTHREVSRHFAVITAHSNGHGNPLDYTAFAAIDTLVFLMGRGRLHDICQGLMAAGRPSDTPAAIVEKATRPDQRSLVSTLAELPARADQETIATPAVIVVGQVAALAPECAAWEALQATA
ncbi:MAG TPA: uroporphyrinogen-III C-methyltransferase [Acidobacteriota bacterium]|nr:uroporphyrinogen-III C-methyltransferase [Acidobacteriota bacterium]